MSKRALPNDNQLAILDVLLRHPTGGVQTEDLRSLTGLPRIQSSLTVCERRGWVALRSVGFDGGMEWRLNDNGTRYHVEAPPEWGHWFWLITEAGCEARQEALDRVWARGEAERMAEAAKEGSA